MVLCGNGLKDEKSWFNSVPNDKILDNTNLKAFADGHLITDQIMTFVFNSLTNDKILDWPKLKAFADNKINVTEKLKFVLGRVENIVGKAENAGTTFSPFPTMFSKSFFLRVVKSWDYVVKS